MEMLIESMQAEWQNLARMTPKIVAALVVFICCIFLGRLFGRGVVRVIARGKFKPTHRNFFRNLVTWLFAAVGIIIGLNLVGLKGLAASLVAGGGITAVVLGFAFREIGENFLSGFFLAFSRPFEVGALIQSGEFQGVVRGIELRSTHIRTEDGRDIFIPNAQIFNSSLINFTRDGLRRLSFTVGIDYLDDAAEARRILTAAVETTKNVLHDPEPRAHMSALGALYVELEVSFWIDTFQQGTDLFTVRNDAIEACRRALHSHGFTVSANVTSNVALGGLRPVDIRLLQQT